ncbi:MAG: hypothetical protein LBK53_08555, partial [Heliobacteriaceae bacterium]|nr:hypothetical protein [Heliobacteriaceae bacterium]
MISRSISFQSKINFVKPKEFRKAWDEKPHCYVGTDDVECCKCGRIGTLGLRTCTGFFINDNGKISASHVWHEQYESDLTKILEKISDYPNSGLIIGGKDHKDRPQALEIFDKIKNKMI